MRYWKIGIIVTFICILQHFISTATEIPYGTLRNGLQASIRIDRQIFHEGEAINLMLIITNISDQTIEIDDWPGNWSLEIFAEPWQLITPISAIDVMRPMPKPRSLQPGQQWETQIEGLSLTTGLPGSTPLWQYKPLSPGTYWIFAKFDASGVIDSYPEAPLETLTAKGVKIDIGPPRIFLLSKIDCVNQEAPWVCRSHYIIEK